MASLRIAFLQSYTNIGAFPIFPTPFQMCSLFTETTDDPTNPPQPSKNEGKKPISQTGKKTYYWAFFAPLLFSFRPYLHAINPYRYSLLHVNDTSVKDYSECQGCIHALELFEDEQICVESIQTEVSVMIDSRVFSETRESEQFEFDQVELSEFQDL